MLTVAILGAGFMGATHANGWKALDGRARVKWVSARSHERAHRIAAAVGAEPTTDVGLAIADAEVDVVDICLPTSLHRAVAEQAFAAGKHVLLEKPIALTLPDAELIARAAQAAGRQLMVGLVLRFFPEYVELGRRVADGELGRPRAASAYRLSPPADWNDWMGDPALSGGTAVDLLIHDFDQLNALLGVPRRVFARAADGAAAHVHALVDYGETHALVEGSMAMPSSYPFSAGMRVACERGAVEHGFRAAPAEGGGNIGAEVDSFLRVYRAGSRPESVPVQSVDPWAAEIAYFAECLESGRAPERGTAEQAIAALRVSLAVARSIESGRPEEVEG